MRVIIGVSQNLMGRWPIVSIVPGRVENRRSNCSLPMVSRLGFRLVTSVRFGLVLFPVPAHRTGQAVFPHPALGRDSRFRPRKVRGPVWQLDQAIHRVQRRLRKTFVAPATALCVCRITTDAASVGVHIDRTVGFADWPQLSGLSSLMSSPRTLFRFTSIGGVLWLETSEGRFIVLLAATVEISPFHQLRIGRPRSMTEIERMRGRGRDEDDPSSIPPGVVYFFLALPSITVFQVAPSDDISYFMSYVLGEVIFTV